MTAPPVSDTASSASRPPAPNGWRRDGSLLSLLVLFLVLHNALWLARDTVNPLFDEAQYLLQSLGAVEELKNLSFGSLSKLYYQNVGVRPTFFFVGFTIPFYALFGVSEDVAVLGANSLFYAVIVFCTYGLGRHFFDRRVGLLAALVTALNHQVGVLSRMYWPHFSVVAIATLGTYLLFKSRRLDDKKYVFLFGLVLGVGLMMRPIYPALFLAAPALLVSATALAEGAFSYPGRDRPIDIDYRQLLANVKSRILPVLLPALLIPVVVAGPFYYKIFSRTLGLVQNMQGKFTERWTDRNPFFWYLQNLHVDMSLFMVICLVVGVAVGLLLRPRGFGAVAFCAAGSIALLSLPSFKAFYYFPPVYPLLSIISVFWLFAIRQVWVRRIAIGLVIVASLAIFKITAWGEPRLTSGMGRTFLAVKSHPPDTHDWKLDEVASLIRKHKKPGAKPVVALLSDTKVISPFSFRYFSWPRGERFKYLAPGDTLKVALLADYIVVRATTRRRLQGDAGWQLTVKLLEDRDGAFYESHRRLATVELAKGPPVELFTRKRRASVAEAEAILRQLIELDAAQAVRLLEKELTYKRRWRPPLREVFERSLRQARTRAAGQS